MKSKGFVAGLLVCGLLVTGAAAAAEMRRLTVTEDTSISVSINGEEQVLFDANGKEVFPLVNEGTTYLPVRAVSALTGYDVNWNEETRTVELTKDEELAPPIVAEPEKKSDSGIWHFRGDHMGLVTTDPDLISLDGKDYDWGIVIRNSLGYYYPDVILPGYLENEKLNQNIHFIVKPSTDTTVKLFEEDDMTSLCFKELKLKGGEANEVTVDVKNSPKVFLTADWTGGMEMVMTDIYFCD